MRGIFYERCPYRYVNFLSPINLIIIIVLNYRNSNNQITRFIGLGNYHNKTSKQKWLYGFVLTPKELSNNSVSFITQSPYSDPSEYIANMLPASKQFFFNTATNSNFKKDEIHKNKKFKGQIKQCK